MLDPKLLRKDLDRVVCRLRDSIRDHIEGASRGDGEVIDIKPDAHRPPFLQALDQVEQQQA